MPDDNPRDGKWEGSEGGFGALPLGGVPVQVHFKVNPVEPGKDPGGRVTHGEGEGGKSPGTIHMLHEVIDATLGPGTDYTVGAAAGGSTQIGVIPAADSSEGLIKVRAYLNQQVGEGWLYVVKAHPNKSS